MVDTINIKLNQLERAADLRRKAETMIEEESVESPDEMRRALYELRVHQIELEMQNEELRLAQAVLEDSRARYFDLYNLAPVGYCTLSEKGLILQANITVANLLGVVRDEIVKKSITRFIVKEDQDIYYLHHKLLIKSGKPQTCELRMMKSNGTENWMHLATTLWQDNDGIPLFFIVLSDINERKHAEAALLESEIFKQSILNSVAAEIAVLDRNGVILAVNNPWIQFSLDNCIEPGTPVSGTGIGDNYFASCKTAECNFMKDGIQTVLDGSLPQFSFEYPCHSPQQQRWFSMCVTPLGDATPIGVVITHADITLRKQAEASLQKSEQMFRSLLQYANDAILLADMNGNLQHINQAGEMLLGYSQDEICQMNVSQIHPVAELANVRQHFRDIATKGGTLPHETKILRQDGRVVDVEIRPSVIEIDGRKLVQGIFIDLTERKQLENERLEHEIKLRTILVREVHHRIKNNLQGITGILRLFAQQHPEVAVPLNQAISQVQSISISHGLQGRSVSSLIRVCELTVEIAAGVEAMWKKPIKVEIPDNWVPCTVTEEEAVPLALVINELISNAAKHSGVDGQIRIMLSHEPHYEAIRLTINNPGLIPPSFGLGATPGFGTGLQLVTSLLPRANASLTWSQQDDTVVTTLGLDKPIIRLESPI